ncbi:MAG: hypothetical protein MI702_07225 [Chlorobiales bacterium]|nr:hypothetical protein [Chlorobiales bacterium]
MREQKAITLYLTGWQKRMIRDHVKASARITRLKFNPRIPKKEWVMYRQPVLEKVKQGAWNLYLTDEQILHVTEALGISAKISALNVTPEMLESGVVVFE